MLNSRNFIFFLLLFSSAAFSQEDQNPHRQLYKANKIKSLKIYDYRYRDGEKKGNGKLLFSYTYDTAGSLIISDSYIPRKFHEEYVYNERGEISDEIADIFGPFHTYFYYEYDAKGRMTEKSKSHDGGKWLYIYDDAGNKAIEKWFYMGNLDTNSYFTDYFEYNDKKQITKMTRHSAGGTLYFYKTYTYDDAGNLVKETRFENNEITDVFTYRYDANHNCIEQETFDPKQEKASTWNKSVYDARGLETEETGLLSSEEKPYYRKYVYEYY
ncbi:MAG: hypothetical protein JWP12_2092 [Bacteroidetes bacterium]|nr:hypothetical protein [Bacteroidota bacterium]